MSNWITRQLAAEKRANARKSVEERLRRHDLLRPKFLHYVKTKIAQIERELTVESKSKLVILLYKYLIIHISWIFINIHALIPVLHTKGAELIYGLNLAIPTYLAENKNTSTLIDCILIINKVTAEITWHPRKSFVITLMAIKKKYAEYPLAPKKAVLVFYNLRFSCHIAQFL